MRKGTSVFCIFMLVVLGESSVFAWGAAAHRFVMRRAIDLLPPEIKPFFVHYRDELVIRVNDPDIWRTAGWDDAPNHFVNFGVSEFGPYPFAALPRELGAALEKFGMATLKRNGLLPWRTAEESGNLRRAFEGFRRDRQSAPGDTVLFSAVVAHYVQDATQPLHATNNYDGQLTGQLGVHARFESALFERFESRLTVTPAPPKPMSSARDATFDALLEGYRLVAPLLEADKQAIAGKDVYDDEYFEKFFAKVKPMLDEQLSSAISNTVAIVVNAWSQSGKPELRTEMPRRAERVRPSR